MAMSSKVETGASGNTFPDGSLVAAPPSHESRDVMSTLDELGDGVQGKIQLMICRKWDATNAYGKYLSTDYVVSDYKGNTMHCTAWSNIAHCFAGTLDEGQIYTFENYTLVPNKDTYRICKDSQHIIQLQGNTIVKHCAGHSPEGFNRYPFDFVPFETLTFNEHKYLIDAIGCVSASSSTKTTRAGSSFVDCHLINERGTSMRVTLWGCHCEEFLSLKKADKQLFTLIFAGLNVKEFRGEVYLSTTSATIIYSSSAIPQMTHFRTQLRNGHVPHASTENVGTIAQLLQTGRDEKAAKAKGKKMTPVTFHCKAKVCSIRTKNRWYYYSCSRANCKKGITRSSGNFFCESCEQSVEFPQTRFKLQMDVADHTGSVVVTLFDELAERIVNRDAETLLRESGDDVDEAILPHDIQRLVGTSHTLELKSYTYYDHGAYESFTCSGIIDTSSAKDGDNKHGGNSLLKRTRDRETDANTDYATKHLKGLGAENLTSQAACGNAEPILPVESSSEESSREE